MIEIVEGKEKPGKVVKMYEMDPLQVMMISGAHEDGCWDENCGLSVRLLTPGEVITVKLFNEEE